MGKAARRARKNENRRIAQEARERAVKRAHARKLGIRIGAIAAVLAIIIGIIWVTRDDDSTVAADDTTSSSSTTPGGIACSDTVPEAGEKQTFKKAPKNSIDPAKFYIATIETSCGTLVAELDAQNAPIATNNFVFLAKKGYYDGLKWHRVVKDFMIQGGDADGTGSGPGPGYSVAGEAPTDGYKLGSLAAAKTGTDPAGTMGSQFFVVTGKQGVALPNDYARFGILTSGLDVARKMASLQADGTEAPSQDLYIVSVTITESDATTTTTKAPPDTTSSTPSSSVEESTSSTETSADEPTTTG